MISATIHLANRDWGGEGFCGVGRAFLGMGWAGRGDLGAARGNLARCPGRREGQAHPHPQNPAHTPPTHIPRPPRVSPPPPALIEDFIALEFLPPSADRGLIIPVMVRAASPLPAALGLFGLLERQMPYVSPCGLRRPVGGPLRRPRVGLLPGGSKQSLRCFASSSPLLASGATPMNGQTCHRSLDRSVRSMDPPANGALIPPPSPLPYPPQNATPPGEGARPLPPRRRGALLQLPGGGAYGGRVLVGEGGSPLFRGLPGRRARLRSAFRRPAAAAQVDRRRICKAPAPKGRAGTEQLRGRRHPPRRRHAMTEPARPTHSLPPKRR